MNTTSDQIARARTIAANPADHAPLDRMRAFATLKEAQGNPIDYRYLPGFHGLGTAESPLACVLAAKSPSITARIRARARQLSDSGPEGAA